MPFACTQYPATVLCNTRDKRDAQRMIVLQERERFTFDIFVYYVEWSVTRIVWIGFYHNVDNDKCYIDRLPKDVVKYILSLLGRICGLPNFPKYIKI